MEILPGWWQMTQMTGMTLIPWIDLSSIADNRDNCENFEAVIWKHSQTIETIGTVKVYPRNHHFHSSNQEWIRFGHCWRRKKKNTKMFATHIMGAIWLKQDKANAWHQVLNIKLCHRGFLLASRPRKIKRKSRWQGTRFALRVRIVRIVSKFFEMTGVIRTIISKPGLTTLQERNLYSQGTVVHLQALFYSKFEISYFKKRNLNQIIE